MREGFRHADRQIGHGPVWVITVLGGWLVVTSDCYELMMPGNLGAIKVPTAEMSANALHYLTGN